MSQPGLITVRQIPERRNDDHLGAGCDQLPEGLREGQVPADQHADLAERRVEGLVRVVQRAGQVRALRMP